MRDASLDPKQASLWLSALANAGSEKAQQVVLDVWADARIGAGIRAAAAAAFFDIAKPSSAALLEALTAHVGSLAQIDGLDASGLLALGAFARRDPSAVVGDRSLLDVVERWGDTARRLGAEDLWLDALANARAPHLSEAALARVTNTPEEVRAAAVRALREVSSTQALAALQQSATQDQSIQVRAAALAALAARPEPEARATIATVLGSESSPEVRRATLLALAQSGVRAQDTATLRALAERDADADVRNLARRLLGRG